MDVAKDDVTRGCEIDVRMLGREMRTVKGSSETAEMSPSGAGRWLYLSLIESSKIDAAPDLLCNRSEMTLQL